MENKKKVRITDRHRALLTETLPFEKLFPFTNVSFHSSVNKYMNSLPSLLEKLLITTSYTIPYDYHITSKHGSSRVLSIIHPAKQIEISSFYEKNKDYILYLCSKSEFSLRRPFANFKYYYADNESKDEENVLDNDGNVETAGDPFSTESSTYRSFFVYKPYSYLFNFYDSWKFLHIEKKFKYLEMLDISKCFYNIYTHTIGWSVKDKWHAKSNSGKGKISFESEFDRLMMESNYNETNGIVVGPEISRIFAEIILQRVDQNVSRKLHSAGIKIKENYTICRYVDDYFIFTNNLSVRDKVIEALKSELVKIKLYINEGKTESYERPFMTSESNAKIEISRVIDEFFEKAITVEGYNKYFNPRLSCNQLLQNIKKCVTANKIDFSSISGGLERFRQILHQPLGSL